MFISPIHTVEVQKPVIFVKNSASQPLLMSGTLYWLNNIREHPWVKTCQLNSRENQEFASTLFRDPG